jgi:ubiquinone/menaquinone biosynthesis C-methylase UbiE
MAHVDYPAWASHVERLWRHLGVRPRRILETAAGTLALAPYLKRPSRHLVHSDLSVEMLRRAPDRNALRVGADYRKLPFRQSSFDAVLCLYDAVDYCLETDGLQAFFLEAERVLKPRGTLVFDFVTSLNSARYFRDFTTHDEIRGAHVVRESSWDALTRMQYNQFTFFLPEADGRFACVREHHMQRIWPLASFRKAAQRAGLAWEGAWDGFTLDPAGRASERIHAACRKAGP